MKTTIDSAGRLAIPKALRREANIKPGMTLELRWRNGRIEIEPAATPVELVQRGRLIVAVPQNDVSPLSVETVEATRKKLRGERLGSAKLHRGHS